ncbi:MULTISPECIES: NACHT domain-containing NTPase [unclassified Apibacter]|uniref:NACHT domain-containing protein n=1 Tax=unclassified Apibacter TaxID=2630820 RepID=UPI00132523B3|nr:MULTISPECIES: NACHT domain-containing protein [unclassified Apibacter]MCX8676516.1 NACHT domain-containing protein [Apibacter sp. B3919]MXO23979.1 NACHT domain-containing protein [Apibacter sp. B3924]MXO26344.1 NACHT domain-containing protein [Apibacter sp. B3813]MXO28295.1 NACHT domain-containing protein [Apibacter sp. B3913]MXO30249.1 NACHT domain-containing protein [Apibacter sp. B3912]
MDLSVGAKLIGTFKDQILNLGNNIKDEYLFIYKNGLIDYINNFYEKYSSIKTFIYRDEKVNFYDIYYPIKIQNKKNSIEINNFNEIFENYQYLTIIGNAGSGKSMLIKHIFLSSVGNCKRIPIIIELRNLNNCNETIEEYITRIISQNKISPNYKITGRILKEGNFIFLLDGYDEIYSENKNKITTDIENFVDRYNKNVFIVTSRPGANAESLTRFDNFEVQSLKGGDIHEFIKMQLRLQENDELERKIMYEINKHENDEYREYLSSPLLLSMFIFTFNNYPELPKQKSKFYWNVFDTLCSKHDSFTKAGGWQHERKSGLKNDELETILKWFSYVSLFEGKYNFDVEYLKTSLIKIGNKLGIHIDFDNVLYDLTTSISILIQDGIEYTFPHKSLQEYFAASLIKSLNNDQKTKIYTEKFSKFFDFSYGGNENFYKLCYELDKINFLKFFLIPQLKFSFPENKNDKNEIFNIICENIGIEYMILTDKYKKIKAGFIFFSSTKYIDLSLSTNDRFELSKPKEIKILNEEFKNYLFINSKDSNIYKKIGMYHIRFKNINHMDHQMIDFIKINGIIDDVYNYYNEIWIYIKKLELEIIKDEKGISELLDIL